MLRHLFLICLLSILFINASSAQDLHFTNYNSSPQNLNPALTGDFRGTMKFGGIYRDQFSQFFENGFRSFGGFLQHNFSFETREGDCVSAGGFLDADQSGDLSFGSTRAGLNLSYNLAGGENHVFTLGLQGVFINRKLDSGNATTGNFLETGNHGEDITGLIQGYQRSQFDFGVGIRHKMYFSDKVISNLGVSVYHLMASNESPTNPSLDYIPLRLNVHGEVLIKTGKSTGLKPRFYYTKSEQASELAFQVLNGFSLAKQNIEVGVGYRVNDAIQFLLGIPFRGWNINAAFDMTTSSARAYNNSFGAFELGLFKVITIHPKTKVKVVQVCPRL